MMKSKKIKKVIKLTIAGSLVFTMIWSNNYHAIHADNLTQSPYTSQPNISPASWEKYAKIDIGGNRHTALDNNKGLLSDAASATNISRKQAESKANDYAKQANFSSKEKTVISSKLPLKSDLTPAYQFNSTLASVIPTLPSWWWTGENANLQYIDTPLHEREVYFANAVSPDNDATANHVLGGKYSCVLRGDSSYTKNGCTIATYPGQVPLTDFEYDGGYSIQTFSFDGWTNNPEHNYLAPVDKKNYTKTQFYADPPILQRSDQNTTLDGNNYYTISSGAVQQFANFVEYDYPKKDPVVKEYLSNNTQQIDAIVDYNTFQPINEGTIEAGRKLILFGVLKDLNTQPWEPPHYIVNAQYATFSTDMMFVHSAVPPKKIRMPAASNVQRRVFYAAKNSTLTAKLPEIIAPQVAVRPMVTMDPSKILYFKNTDSGQNSVTGSTVNTDVQFAAPSSAGVSNPVKPTIKDTAQHVDGISVPTTGDIPNDPNILKVDEATHTIYVKPNTKELKLKVDATYANNSGTTPYITAIGNNVFTSKTVLGRLAKGGAASTDVTLNLQDTLLNTNTLGNIAVINLYTEELSNAGKSDYIAAVPYPITVVVAQDQTIAFDAATQALNGTDVTYGDKDITIDAAIIRDNVSQPWDMNTPISVSIDTTDPADAETAEVVSQSSSLQNLRVTAKIHLKDGIGGNDGKIKINIKKPASADGKYLAAQQKQIILNVKKRAITITPLITTMHVMDTYPPAAWPYKAVKTTDPMVDGLVNGDIIPYTFTTVDIGAISGGSASPPLNNDGTTIKDTAIDKKWGINLIETSPTAAAAFDKKYIPTIHDYQSGNKKSILQVKRKFDPIRQSDISKQPQYVEVKPGQTKAEFSTTFTYPIKDVNGQSIDAAYQDLDYQWYKKDALGKIEPFYPVTAKMEILPNLSDTQGQARFSFTIDPIQNDDNLTSYYCEVWNDMNVSNPIRTDMGELTAIQEPSAYVEYPSTIKVTNSDTGVQGDSSIKLRDITADNKATPKGIFDIQSDPEVKLYLNGDTAITDFNKIYIMKVLTTTGTPVGDDRMLMKLRYPAQTQSKFTLKNDETDKKDWGIYQGTMNFTMTYKPHEGTSP